MVNKNKKKSKTKKSSKRSKQPSELLHRSSFGHESDCATYPPLNSGREATINGYNKKTEDDDIKHCTSNEEKSMCNGLLEEYFQALTQILKKDGEKEPIPSMTGTKTQTEASSKINGVENEETVTRNNKQVIFTISAEGSTKTLAMNLNEAPGKSPLSSVGEDFFKENTSSSQSTKIEELSAKNGCVNNVDEKEPSSFGLEPLVCVTNGYLPNSKEILKCWNKYWKTYGYELTLQSWNAIKPGVNPPFVALESINPVEVHLTDDSLLKTSWLKLQNEVHDYYFDEYQYWYELGYRHEGCGLNSDVRNCAKNVNVYDKCNWTSNIGDCVDKVDVYNQDGLNSEQRDCFAGVVCNGGDANIEQKDEVVNDLGDKPFGNMRRFEKDGRIKENGAVCINSSKHLVNTFDTSDIALVNRDKMECLKLNCTRDIEDNDFRICSNHVDNIENDHAEISCLGQLGHNQKSEMHSASNASTMEDTDLSIFVNWNRDNDIENSDLGKSTVSGIQKLRKKYAKCTKSMEDTAISINMNQANNVESSHIENNPMESKSVKTTDSVTPSELSLSNDFNDKHGKRSLELDEIESLTRKSLKDVYGELGFKVFVISEPYNGHPKYDRARLNFQGKELVVECGKLRGCTKGCEGVHTELEKDNLVTRGTASVVTECDAACYFL